MRRPCAPPSPVNTRGGVNGRPESCEHTDLLEARNINFALLALKRHHTGGRGDLGRGCGLFGGTGRRRLGLNQHSRISSLCVCARVLRIYQQSVHGLYT